MRSLGTLLAIIVVSVLVVTNHLVGEAKEEVQEVSRLINSRSEILVIKEEKMSTLETCVCWIEEDVKRKTIITSVRASGETYAQFIKKHLSEVTNFSATVDEVSCD